MWDRGFFIWFCFTQRQTSKFIARIFHRRRLLFRISDSSKQRSMADFTTSTHRAKWIFTPQALVMIFPFKTSPLLVSRIFLLFFSLRSALFYWILQKEKYKEANKRAKQALEKVCLYHFGSGIDQYTRNWLAFSCWNCIFDVGLIQYKL